MRQAHLSPPTPEDITHLASNMRANDAYEARMLGGVVDLRQHVEDAVRWSRVSLAVRAAVDTPLLCIIGVIRGCGLMGDATLWELSTTEVDRHPLAFLSICRSTLRIVAKAVPEAHYFTNIVPQEHTRTLRWLTWLGASTQRPVTIRSIACIPFSFDGVKLRED